MSRVSLFNHPLLLGFDHFERTLDRLAKKGADGYPPYNIEQLDDGRLRITIAVAGFSDEDLSVEVVDSQLVIQGRRQDDESPEGHRLFLHKGIAARQFQRSFLLADGIHVTDAILDNGLLHINLLRPEPESRVRKIEISTR